MGSRLSEAIEAAAPLFRPADLTLRLHAAADRMANELNGAAVAIGLTDARDWLVLAALEDGQQRSQLGLSRLICLDKTTLIAVLDRLEERRLVLRTVDPSDRRARIPQITVAGRRVFAKFAAARDAAEERALAGVSDAQRGQLLDLLGRIADRGAPA